jgi:ribosomal protein S27AE
MLRHYGETAVVRLTMRCPACGEGSLRKKRVHEEMFGVDLGVYEAEVCDSCGESFMSATSMDKIEARAKELGLWGLASKVKVGKSGNSLVVRIPAALARYLRMRSGQEVLVAPDRANRLVLEFA